MARKLALKLMQSSPLTTLTEASILFREAQDLLEGRAQDEVCSL